jgi:hypothetical protein
MILAAKFRVLTPLMAIALAVFVTGLQGAVAQDTGNPSKKVAPEQAKAKDAKPGSAQSPPKSTPPAARPPKRSTIPKPTVVLKPGEVPAIVFAEPVCDFGRVRSGEKITHEFVFNNTGNGPLEILRVKPG